MNALQTLASVLAMTSTPSPRVVAGSHLPAARADAIRYLGRAAVTDGDLRRMERAAAKRATRAVRNLRDLPQAQP